MENKVPRTANAALRKAFARRRHPHTPLDAFHFAPKARNDTLPCNSCKNLHTLAETYRGE
jgi:hypothetical protein